MAAVTNSL